MSNNLMKKIGIAAQVVALLSAFAVNGNSTSVAAQTAPDASHIELQSSQAATDGRAGVLIQWQTSSEVGNMGFRVYRRDNDRDVQLTRNLIAGSAIIAGRGNNALKAGNSYSFYDRKGTPNSLYVIESLDVNGATQTFTVKPNYDVNFRRLVADRAKSNPGEAQAGRNVLESQFVAPVEVNATGGNSEIGGQPTASTVQDSDKQRFVAGQPGLKFGVKKNGLYRVTLNQLQTAGFNVAAPAANWQLYADGIEQSIILTGTQSDGTLGANGYLEFYGTGLDTPFSDTHVYYLIAGSAPGKRILPLLTRGFTSKAAAASYSVTSQRKDRTSPYLAGILNGEAENYFGDLVYNAATDVSVSTTYIDRTAATANVEVVVQGYSNNNHNVSVSLKTASGYTTLGTLTGIGTQSMRGVFAVPISQLTDDTNTIRLTSGAGNDFSFVDYVNVNYQRRFVAAGNQLSFTTVYNYASKVENFTDSSIRVFDVSDPNNTRTVKTNVDSSNGTYSVNIASSRPRNMLAVANSAVLTPASITFNNSSSVYSTASNKDLVIVTYKDWKTQANDLAAYRRAQGLSVEVVDVEDIFDEFSFGVVNPHGIKDFFRTVTPRYALLIGDASHDARGYTGTYNNFIPSMPFDSVYGEVSSDEGLGDCLDSNNQPGINNVAEFPIGRISIRNAAQAQSVIDKIKRFEQNLPANPYSRGILFVNDDFIDYDFYQSNQSFKNQMPSGTTTVDFQRNGATNSTAAPVRTNLVNEISKGYFIVNYTGHGSINAWTSASILRTPAETGSLTNTGQANAAPSSIFVLLTCLNGAFADEYNDSLAEGLSKANGGGAAVWSSSGLTIADSQDIMAKRFYKLLAAANSGARIGDLMHQAKDPNVVINPEGTVYDPDVRASWILFGDPTMKVR